MTEHNQLLKKKWDHISYNMDLVQQINRFRVMIDEHNTWSVPQLPPNQVVELMRSLDALYATVSQVLNEAYRNKIIGLGKAKRVIVVPEKDEYKSDTEDLNSIDFNDQELFSYV